MTKYLTLFFALFFSLTAAAQVNLTLRDSLDYGETKLNDIWGWYDAETEKEYAIVGARTGVSIVEVTDPDDIVERAFLPGPTTVWRDLKTWGDYAYVTNEEANGLQVIFLGDLPDGGEVTSFNWTPVLPGGDTLQTCHNLFIDEFGYCYLAGCNPINGGGVIVVDVFSTPGQPQFVSYGNDVYSHDVYARDNIVYSSEIGEGIFTIYDANDKQNIFALGSSPTLFNTTHNAWLSDDGNYLFTTDEKANATTGSYDISDFTDIEVLDNWRPQSTVGTGVVPHNTHVLDDYLITSHYTDGGIIVDASEPTNLVEVGNYDTSFDFTTGFHGCWGAYPYSPNGLIFLSDIENGLYVLTPNYVRAARLEGTVTDAATGAPVAFTDVVIDAAQVNAAVSDFTGGYKTGLAEAGTFAVTYDAPGYLPQTVSVVLENGVTTIQDIQLDAAPRYDLTGNIVRADNGDPVPFGHIEINDGFFTYTTQADENGVFIFEQIFEGEYSAVTAAWHFEYKLSDFNLNEDSEITVELERGYRDDFLFDLGWETSATTLFGEWERAEPVVTFPNPSGAFGNPGVDIAGDFGESAYVTGNSDALDYVDDGTVVLTSQPMDLTIFDDPYVRYRWWIYNRNAEGFRNEDARFRVLINNGVDEVVLQSTNTSGSFWQSLTTYQIADFIEITDNMRLKVVVINTDPDFIVEGGFDVFRITEGNTTATDEADVLSFGMSVFPNPFSDALNFEYDLPSEVEAARVTVFNQIGQVVFTEKLNAGAGNRRLGQTWRNGIYFLQLEAEGKILRTERVVKVK